MSAEKEAFYEKYAQAAIDQQIKYGIPASVTLSQMAIESGMGTNTLSTALTAICDVASAKAWLLAALAAAVLSSVPPITACAPAACWLRFLMLCSVWVSILCASALCVASSLYLRSYQSWLALRCASTFFFMRFIALLALMPPKMLPAAPTAAPISPIIVCISKVIIRALN